MSEVTVETAGGMTSTFSTEDLNRIINILGKRDVRMFLPLFESDPADGEAVQDYGPRGHHFLKHTTSDNDPYIRGSPLAMRFNGADEAIDMADNDDFSMDADGTAPNEPAFSLGLAVRFNDVSDGTLIARFDETNAAENCEYLIRMVANDINFRVYDETDLVYLGRLYNFALTNDQWYIIICTYDGSATNAGISIYLDGVRVDDTASGGGVYTAMHNMAVATTIGVRTGAGGAYGNFLDGDVWGPFITARELDGGGVASGEPAAPGSDITRLTNVYRRVLGL